MSGTLICYSKCSTCNKAKKWLMEQGIDFEERDIKTERPSKEELEEWVKKSGLPIKKFFNTSGILYREMNLKEKLATATEEEMVEILSSNGMLVKRPLVVTDKGVLIGFKKDKWEEFFK